MKYNKLGTSELLVSEIAFGTWRTFGKGIPKERAISCIKSALENGINFIDTANVYCKGEAESIIGEALKEVNRNSYILSTKLFFPMTENDYGLSRAQIYKQIELSLKRLRTDYIDLYQCHRYDPDTPLEETMEALTDLIQQGKVRYIGFSEWPVEKVILAMNLTGVRSFVSSQPQYSMLWRNPERELFPTCESYKISQIVWAPLAEGILTGKYLPNAPLPRQSRAAHIYMGKQFPSDFLDPFILEAVQKVNFIAARSNLTLAQFALAWVLRKKIVAGAIIGATNQEQIIENIGASGKKVNSEDFEEAEFIIEKAQQQRELKQLTC